MKVSLFTRILSETLQCHASECNKSHEEMLRLAKLCMIQSEISREKLVLHMRIHYRDVRTESIKCKKCKK